MIRGILKKLFQSKTEESSAPKSLPSIFTFSSRAPHFTLPQNHPLRDSTTGYLDNREARLALVNYIKKEFTDNDNYIIALDAQNLGVLNDTVGRDAANKIWKAYSTEYIKALQNQFPSADVITGFKGAGDETQIIISGKNIPKQKIDKAFAIADAQMQKTFSNTGLMRVPSRDGLRPEGFKLHHATCPFFSNSGREESEAEAIKDYDYGLMNNQMLDFHLIQELSIVMTNLNQNKAKADPRIEQMTPKQFIDNHRTQLLKSIKLLTSEEPNFTIPEEVAKTFSSIKDSDASRQKHQEFLEQMPPDTVLVRFDLTGLRMLNKTLHSIEVESILGDVHRRMVSECFKILSSTYNVPVAFFEVRSGVTDAVVGKDIWEKKREDTIDHVNWRLNNLYEFHLLKPFSETYDRLGIYPTLNNEEKTREALLKHTPEHKKELLAALEKEMNWVETPIIQGNVDATLQNIHEAMDELKATLLPTQQQSTPKTQRSLMHS